MQFNARRVMPLHLMLYLQSDSTLRECQNSQFVDHQNLTLILDGYVGLIQLVGTAKELQIARRLQRH